MSGVAINFGIQFIWYAVLSVIVYNLFLVVTRFRQVKFSWNVGGFFLPCLPLVGNSYVALLTGKPVSTMAMLLWTKKYFGMPFNFWFGNNYHYVSDNAEEIRIILNHPKCYNKAQLYDNVQYIIKNAILLIEAEKWKLHRRFLRNAYKTSMLESFVTVIDEQCCQLIEQIKSLNPHENISSFFNKHAFRIFFLTSSGLPTDNLTPEVERLGELIARVQDEFVKLLLNPVIPAFIWTKTPSGVRCKKLLKECKDTLNEAVMNKKRQRATEYIDNPTEVPLVDLLLSDEYEKESEFDIINEYALFAGAATDTSGQALLFCFTILGMYPDIQQRVYEEVMSVVGDRSTDVSNIRDLNYTEAVISETLRMFPTVPGMARYCSEDINLGTKIIPKGSNFIANVYHTHRNPKYWKDPMKFEPSRFFRENIAKIVPGSYLPFSLGPRNCVGQSFAMMILKVTVAHVIRNFQITSNHKSFDEFILESSISMKTENELDCVFKARVKNGH